MRKHSMKSMPCCKGTNEGERAMKDAHAGHAAGKAGHPRQDGNFHFKEHQLPGKKHEAPQHPMMDNDYD